MSYNLLKGKRGIIFGALNEQSIAWKVAEKAVQEAGKLRLEGKEYLMQDGDIVLFRFNV